MQTVENADLLNRFLSQSSSFDCADVSIVFLRYLVGRNILQTIPVSKVKDWDKTIPLFTQGHYPDGREASKQGVAPYTVVYAAGPDGQKFAAEPSDWLTASRPSPTPTPSASVPTWSAGRSRAGPTWSAPSSRARRHCRTSRPSASSMSPWRWRRAGTSSTATRAT